MDRSLHRQSYEDAESAKGVLTGETKEMALVPLSRGNDLPCEKKCKAVVVCGTFVANCELTSKGVPLTVAVDIQEEKVAAFIGMIEWEQGLVTVADKFVIGRPAIGRFVAMPAAPPEKLVVEGR